MQMNNTPFLMLNPESGGVRGDLINAATIVPNGINPTSRRVVVGVHHGANKTPRALLEFGLNAQKLRGGAAQLLQQGNMRLPVGKNLPVCLE